MQLEITPESESAVLIDRMKLSDELGIGLSVANMIYIYEAVNSTVHVSDLFKVSHLIWKYRGAHLVAECSLLTSNNKFCCS